MCDSASGTFSLEGARTSVCVARSRQRRPETHTRASEPGGDMPKRGRTTVPEDLQVANGRLWDRCPFFSYVRTM